MDHRRQSSLRRPAPAEPQVVLGDWKRMNEIGKGSFAMVYRGEHVVSPPPKGILCLCKT